MGIETRPPSPDHFKPHDRNFIIALGSTIVFLGIAAVAYPPALYLAVISIGAAINEARQIPELN